MARGRTNPNGGVWNAPFLLSPHQDQIPEGMFLLPVCTNRERFGQMLDALYYYKNAREDYYDLTHMIDVLEAIAHIVDPSGSGCVGEDADCLTYPMTTSFVQFAPTNPYLNPDEVPDGYATPPFRVLEAGDDDVTLYYLAAGDVMAVSPPIAAGLNFPRFRVTVTGEREVELHLLTHPFGGDALISVDGDLIPIVVDLHRDLTAVPPESAVETVQEIQLTGMGVHTIDVTFVPALDNDLIDVGFGGGIRKLVICGDEVMAGQTQVRQNPENLCELQVSHDDGLTWNTVADLGACTPMVRRLRQNPEQPCHIEYSPFAEDDIWFVVADLRLCQNYRWRGGILEWFDGDEWTPIDTVDPVYDEPPPPIPRPETEPNDKRCSAAASATYAYMDLANRLYGLLNVTPPPFITSVAADYAGIVSNTLNFFMSSDAFTNLVANAAFQVNMVSYITDLAFLAGDRAEGLMEVLDLTNPETREKLKCALYCAMSETGNIASETAFEAIDDAISNSGLAEGWSRFIELFGAGGVNAAISVNAFSVPASECDCECPEEWCFTWDFTTGTTHWSAVSPYGHYVTSSGWRETTNQGLILDVTFDETTITKVVYECASGNLNTPTGCAIIVRNNGANVSSEIAAINTLAVWEGNAISDQIWLNPFGGTESTHLITTCTIYGIGECPFGEPNCEPD